MSGFLFVCAVLTNWATGFLDVGSLMTNLFNFPLNRGEIVSIEVPCSDAHCLLPNTICGVLLVRDGLRRCLWTACGDLYHTAFTSKKSPNEESPLVQKARRRPTPNDSCRPTLNALQTHVKTLFAACYYFIGFVHCGCGCLLCVICCDGFVRQRPLWLRGCIYFNNSFFLFDRDPSPGNW